MTSSAGRGGSSVASGRMAALVAIVLALLLGACGESSDDPPASGAGPALVAPINLANCADWNAASVDERLATIQQLKDYVGGEIAGTEGSGGVLDDDKAFDLFENYCSEYFARGFKLYKLYSRAAAFSDQ